MTDPTSAPTPAEPAGGFLSAWQVPTLAVGFLPAAGAGLSGRAVTQVLHGLALVGSGGMGAAVAGITEANQPVLGCLTLALVVTLVFAIGQSIRPPRTPPPVFTCLAVLVLSSFPLLLLWSFEDYFVAVLTNHLAASVSDASAHLSFLLLATFLTSFAAPGASFLAVLGLAVRGRKPGARQRLQGSVWWIAVFVLAAFAVAFYLRNAALHQIAITGRP